MRYEIIDTEIQCLELEVSVIIARLNAIANSVSDFILDNDRVIMKGSSDDELRLRALRNNVWLYSRYIEAAKTSLDAIRRILQRGKIRELWSDLDSLSEWYQGTEDLRNRLADLSGKIYKYRVEIHSYLDESTCRVCHCESLLNIGTVGPSEA